MHWSITNFDYLIIETNDTTSITNIANNLEYINELFIEATDDNSYPYVVSVYIDNITISNGTNTSNGTNMSKQIIRDNDMHEHIMEIISVNHGILNSNFISVCLKQTSDTIEHNSDRFILSNIAEIAYLIGSEARDQDRLCEFFDMKNLIKLSFYENNGFTVVVATFDIDFD
jgi:hypothetical protein